MMNHYNSALSLVLLFCVAPLFVVSVSAQPLPDGEQLSGETEQQIESELPDENSLTDARIEQRLNGIFAMLEPLSGVEVQVSDGVVLLSGAVSNEAQAERALSLATQMPDVILVDDDIQRRLDVQGNLSPLLQQFENNLMQWARALPLFAIALLILAVIVYLGYGLARWTALWRRLTPNAFLSELVAQTVRVIAVLLGLIVALSVMGATALMATILGSAGVVGLAIGFAVRDTIENYISSIMLSLRQPFRANDHVVINEHEGKVVRLTSRATVLMTLDGNQLRIPNATVFKAVILNYSSNPQRRFTFELGVDAADDPVAAMKAGVDALTTLPFVLAEPEPNSLIQSVGDSNIILLFTAWVDQEKTDFGRARSLAIRIVTSALDQQGFTMPEPIYRLRFDNTEQSVSALSLEDRSHSAVNKTGTVSPEHDASSSQVKEKHQLAGLGTEVDADKLLDVSPDRHLEDMVNDERAQKKDDDLLDSQRPIE